MGVDRKGFVYTLEAVIASSIVLGTSLFVIPNAVPEPEPNFDSVEKGLISLQSRGELDSSVENVTEDIEPFAPQSYNVTVRMTSVDKTEGEVKGGESFQLRSGYKKLLLWIDSSTDLEITYRGNSVLDSDKTGYRELELERSSGYLNFTGSADLKFEVQRYQSEGSLPSSDTVISRNVIGKDEREIQVVMWQ
jgi:hypothetical protein